MKWGFTPQGDGKPHYLVVNADESEPGTCKDIPLMLATPHMLVEGAIITCFAIRAEKAFIYVRGEVLHVVRRVQQAVAEAQAAGYLGRDILGSGYDLDLVVHAGAGAYICGEETALLDSLEGYRGQPRLKPPFPAVEGLYACPTVINNVESIASVPSILANGGAVVRRDGHREVHRLRHLLAQRARDQPRASTRPRSASRWPNCWSSRAGSGPGTGSSSGPPAARPPRSSPTSIWMCRSTSRSMAAAGSMLGTRALQIFDETTCVVRAVLRWTEFYEHESCGKCTPCREGTFWMVRVLERLEHGRGSEEDLEKLLDICDNILGRAFCALGDGAVSPVTSSIKYFRDEYLEHQKRGGCPFDPAAATIWATGTGRGR